jgi:hypothetical protein
MPRETGTAAELELEWSVNFARGASRRGWGRGLRASSAHHVPTLSSLRNEIYQKKAPHRSRRAQPVGVGSCISTAQVE